MGRRIDFVSFSNVRDLMAAIYNLERSLPFGSYRTLAKKCGFKSPVFIKLVIDGKRRLTKNSAKKIAFALKMRSHEKTYFFGLVDFERAKNSVDREREAQKLAQLRSKIPAKFITGSKLQLFSKWISVVIRELAGAGAIKDNLDRLASSLGVTRDEVEQSIASLLNLGLITSDGKNRWISAGLLTTADGLTDQDLIRFHKTMLTKAGQSLDIFRANVRQILGAVVTLSEGAMNEIRDETHRFRERVLQTAAKDGGPYERVFYFGAQLFPLSGPISDLLENEKDQAA